MTIRRSIAVAATAALFATPALAADAPANQGNKPAENPGHAIARGHDSTPGPNAPASTKAKAYGKRCQGQSKKHVKGEKGTAFSRCVTAMAKVASGHSTPHAACASLSKKHVKGEKGTAFSRCVRAAAKLRASKQDESQS